MYEEMTGNSRQGRYINAEKKYVATKKYEKQEIIYIYESHKNATGEIQPAGSVRFIRLKHCTEHEDTLFH